MGFRFAVSAVLCLLLALPNVHAGVGETLVPGDVNCDESVDISDAISLLSYLYLGTGPPCPHADRPELLERVATLEEAVTKLQVQLETTSSALEGCTADLQRESELLIACQDEAGLAKARVAELSAQLEQTQAELADCLRQGPTTASYKVMGLGSLQGVGRSYMAKAINEKGQVVGYLRPEEDGQSYAGFIWEKGAIAPLTGFPTGESIFPEGINNEGQVVGSVASPSKAFVWDSGTLTYIGNPFDSKYSTATDINDQGQVVGQLERAGFLWEKGTMKMLPGAISAEGINSAGDIVGNVRAGSGSHAAFFRGDSLIDLGDLPGGREDSIAMGINDVGQIVGYGSVDSESRDLELRAVIWESASAPEWTMLGTLGKKSPDIYAWGINNKGQVVGQLGIESGIETRAFLWDSGNGMRDLNHLTYSAADWRLLAAYDINDSGQIVGFGINPEGEYAAYLLTPVP